MIHRLAILLIRAYQSLIRPHLGGGCRHVPSCSNYCVEAIERHGVLHGVSLTARRLSRCHPLGTSGYDPVP